MIDAGPSDGSDVRAKSGDLLAFAQCSENAGDFLPELDRADRGFGGIGVEGDPREFTVRQLCTGRVAAAVM